MTASSRARRAGVATGMVGALAAVAGCGLAAHMTTMAAKAPAQAHVTSQAPGRTGPSQAGSATTAQASGSTSVTAASSQSGPLACTTHALQVSVGAGNGAAGSTGQVIDFQNVSQHSCTLFGFPGVAFSSRRYAASQIGRPASRSTAAPAAVISLAPGETAHVLVQIADALNYPTSTCLPVHTSYLQVYPPNQRRQVYLPYATLACSQHVNTLTVTAVQRGRDRNGN